MKTHFLKTWPQYYERVISGVKTFELRKNDRNFQTGDIVVLQEYDPKKETYTAAFTEYKISYILHGGQFGIEQGYCVFGLLGFTR